MQTQFAADGSKDQITPMLVIAHTGRQRFQHAVQGGVI